jgi:hypothetical protein
VLIQSIKTSNCSRCSLIGNIPIVFIMADSGKVTEATLAGSWCLIHNTQEGRSQLVKYSLRLDPGRGKTANVFC